jgi:hypothetical protein
MTDFSLQFRDQFLSSVDRLLIVDRAQNVAIPLNRLVDLNALVTHPAVPYRVSIHRYDEQATFLFKAILGPSQTG